MAVPLDQSSKEDDLKTQFVTREGTYRLMNLSEYSRPNRVGYTSNQNSPQVRVSLVSLLAGDGTTSGSQEVQEGATNGHGPDDLQVNQISSTTPSTSMTLDHGVAGNGPVGAGQRGSFIPGGDRICFNFGKELFVYPYRGMKKVRKSYFDSSGYSCITQRTKEALRLLLLLCLSTSWIIMKPKRHQ